MDDGRYADAVKSFERVLMLAPDSAKTYPLLGECLMSLKQKDCAIETLKKGLVLAKKAGDKELCETIAELLKDAESPPPATKE